MLRKIAMMVAFYLFEGEKAWLLGTAVVGVSMVLHVAAQPHENKLTDMVRQQRSAAQIHARTVIGTARVLLP